MREYVFKPAALRGEQVWTIKDGHLMRRGGARAIKLADVTGAVWGRFAYRGTQSQWFHLKDAGGLTKIECNVIAGGDQAVFEELVGDVCEAIAQHNPDLKVHISGGGGYMWAMFIIGVLGGVFGLVFLLAGLLGWVKRSEMELILVGGGMAAVLSSMAWRFAPWRAKQFVPMADFAASRLINGPAMGAPHENASDQ